MSPQFRRQMVSLSPEFFLTYYLGFKLPMHQQKWIKLWRVKYLLDLAPRDHGKSWIFSYGHPLYEIYADFVKNNLEEVKFRFLQISKTDDQSSKYANQVRETIERNPYLREDFGNIQDSDHWLKGYFACKRKDTAINIEKDHTYEKTGVLGGITGGHFEFINVDDPLDDENTKNTERMDSVENWFWGTVWNLRETYTRIRVVGTRKNRRDLFNTLIQSPLWKKNIERAIIKYPMIIDRSTNRQIQGWLYKTDKGRHVRNMSELRSEEIIVDVELLTDDYEVLWPSTEALNEKGEIEMTPVIDQDTGEEIGQQPKVFGWGIKELLLDRAGSGASVFDREKQNEINAEEGGVFKKDWLHLFNQDQLYLNDQDSYFYLLPEAA